MIDVPFKEAERMLLGGVHLSVADWLAMSVETRTHFADAGLSIIQAHAAMVGVANGNSESATAMLRDDDPDDLLVAMALDAILENAVEKVKGD